MYQITFLNGSENLKKEGLKALKDRKKDLDLFLNYSSLSLHNLVKALKEFDPYKTDLITEIEEEIKWGAKTFWDLPNHLQEEIQDLINEWFSNYGLCFDFVEDKKDCYFCYQLSWGGPCEEIRFHKNGLIEFVYLDWFCGIGFDVTSDPIFDNLYNYFYDIGLIDFEKENV